MKRNYCFSIIALLVSLFLYLFYRTEKTVVTEIFISSVSYGKFSAWKASISTILPLNKIIVYSLPEALWVFAITLTSKPFFLKISTYTLELVYIPILFCTGLELLQWLHITNGRFDLMDIGLSFLLWLLAMRMPYKKEKQNIFSSFSFQNIACISSYCIVYLAHVWK